MAQEREQTLTRREFMTRAGATAVLLTTAIALELGHARAKQVWNSTLQTNPLGSKLQDEQQTLAQLKAQYNQQGASYDQRVQISKEYDQHERLATEMAADISKTIDPSNRSDAPHFRWWLSDSTVLMGAVLGIPGLFGLVHSLRERFGRGRQSQQPQPA